MQMLENLSSDTRLVFSGLNEKQTRHVAALISKILGYGGQTQVAQVTGIDLKTIRRGCRDLDSHLAECPKGRIRKPGGGRPSTKKIPDVSNEVKKVADEHRGGVTVRRGAVLTGGVSWGGVSNFNPGRNCDGQGSSGPSG